MVWHLKPPALEPFLVTVQVEGEFWVGDMVYFDRKREALVGEWALVEVEDRLQIKRREEGDQVIGRVMRREREAGTISQVTHY